MSAHELWKIKTGRTVPDDNGRSIAAKHGQVCEDFVAREFAEKFQKHVFPYPKMLKHHNHPLVGHVDRLVGGDCPGKGVTVLEIKTVVPFKFNLINGWGTPGTNQIPYNYNLQLIGYMALTDAEYADLAVLVGGVSIEYYRVERNLASEKSILQYVKWWWTEHVVNGKEPSVDSGFAPYVTNKPAEVSPAFATKLGELAQLQSEFLTQKHSIEYLIKEIDSAYPNATELFFNNKRLAVITRMKSKTKIDVELLSG
jgi:predicted phage-related endonuclease